MSTLATVSHRIVVFGTMAFLLAPTAIVVLYSFYPDAYVQFPPQNLTVKWYAAAFEQRHLFLDPFFTSLVLAAAATTAATVIGLLVAFVLVRRRLRFRGTVSAFFTAPLLVPTVTVGFALMLFLPKLDLLGTFAGLFIGHMVITMPFSLQAIVASLSGFSETIEEAAVTLGSSPLRALRKVTLRLVASGILAGAVFAFVISFDELNMTLFIATPTTVTLPVQLFSYIQQRADPTIAAVSTVIVAVAFVALLVLQKLGGLDRRVY